MLAKWMGAVFAPKYPMFYTGRHRAHRLRRMEGPSLPAGALT
jgi:hypothetical protein